MFVFIVGSHALIIDKIQKGQVHLRDPLPQGKGSSYSVSQKNFNSYWRGRTVTID